MLLFWRLSLLLLLRLSLVLLLRRFSLLLFLWLSLLFLFRRLSLLLLFRFSLLFVLRRLRLFFRFFLTRECGCSDSEKQKKRSRIESFQVISFLYLHCIYLCALHASCVVRLLFPIVDSQSKLPGFSSAACEIVLTFRHGYARGNGTIQIR